MRSGSHLASSSGWALMRQVPDCFGQGLLEFQTRVPIDVGVARKQQESYRQIISKAGYDVFMLPPLTDCPDCPFVEDVALVFDEIGIAMQPGRAERRGETKSVQQFLQETVGLDVVEMPRSCTADGGDVLAIDRDVFVGLSTRTNWDGFAFIRRIVESKSRRVYPIEVLGALHLKSACTHMGNGTLLVAMHHLGAGRERLKKYRLMQTSTTEPGSANVVNLDGTLIVPTGFPHLAQRLSNIDVPFVQLNISELQKAEAGLSCLTIFGKYRIN